MRMDGWDTIYAVDLGIASRAFAVAVKEALPTLRRDLDGAFGRFAVDVRIGDWRIASGGAPRFLRLTLTIAQGAITPAGAAPVALTGLCVEFLVGLSLLAQRPEAARLSLALGRAAAMGTAPAPGLVVPAGHSGAVLDPSVTALVLHALAAALVAEADRLAFALAEIELQPVGARAWLAPGHLEYACFENGKHQAFLAILSTRAAPPGQPAPVDPALTASGSAGFAFSLPLFLRHCVLPDLVAALPGASADAFAFEDDDGPCIRLRPERPLALGQVRAGAIDYTPRLLEFEARPGVGQMLVTCRGDCDLRAGISMTWNARVINPFVLDEATQAIAFGAATPSLGHATHVPWYWWLASPLVSAIAMAIAELIANEIAAFIGGRVGVGLVSADAPAPVRFAGMQSFHATSASLDGAVVLAGVAGAS